MRWSSLRYIRYLLTYISNIIFSGLFDYTIVPVGEARSPWSCQRLPTTPQVWRFAVFVPCFDLEGLFTTCKYLIFSSFYTYLYVLCLRFKFYFFRLNLCAVTPPSSWALLPPMPLSLPRPSPAGCCWFWPVGESTLGTGRGTLSVLLVLQTCTAGGSVWKTFAWGPTGHCVQLLSWNFTIVTCDSQ